MKISNNHRVVLAALILGIFTLMSGCASTGTQLSAKTGKTMAAVEDDIKQSIAQVDITSASLQDVINPSQADTKKAFSTYSDNVNKMEALGEQLIEQTDKMSTQKTEYFAELKNQGETYINPEIQAISEQRRTNLNSAFAKISESKVGVIGTFKAYMSDIREIQRYLLNDLTTKGIEAITPIAEKAIIDGNNFKVSVEPVLSAVSSAREEFTPAGKK